MAPPRDYVPVTGSERQPARGATRIADADPNESLSVTIRVRRRSGGPPLPSLDALAAIPLNERKFPSREEFARLYGAAEEDLSAVASFAENHGLTVTGQSAGERTVHIAGTVFQMNAAFGVKLGRYESPTETYRGREGLVYIPRALGEIVESVLGLDNRNVVRPHIATSGGNVAAARPDGSLVPGNSPPAGASALTPPQVASLYGFPANTATGQTVAILEFGGGYAKADITAFLTPLGIATPTLIDQAVDGGSNSPAGSLTNVTANDADIEVALDIDVVAAVAVGAKIVVYFAPNNDQAFADAVSQAVHDTTHAPTIISCSWAGSEDSWSGSARSSMVTALNDAAALGVTVFFTSGDDGSDDGVGDGSAHVEYPAAEYGAIGCGGTYIANVSGSSFTEGTWNDVGATGGGVSDVYGLPAWQDGIGVPKSANNGTTVGRGVPDVSGNASPYSGYNLTLYGTLTTSLVITSGSQKGQTIGTIGGTSAVAPLYAALLALIEAKIGEPLGYLTPLLYALQNDGPIADINDGANNKWSGEAKPAPSYTCGAGWDACTGLGRINGGSLLSAFQRVFAKQVGFEMDQTTFSQDEVELQLPGTAKFAAYWVAVDGFRPQDLGLNSGNLGSPPAASIPTISAAFDPALSGAVRSALQAMIQPGTFAPPVVPQDPSLPNVPQRFLYPFTVGFAGDSGFQAMKAASPAITSTVVTVTAKFNDAGSSLGNSGQLELTTGEDPRFEDVNPQVPRQAPWLSFDLRFFKMTVPPGGTASRFNASITGAADAPAFIAKAIDQLTRKLTGSDTFGGLEQDENASALEFQQRDDSGKYVYNFAVARVRLLAKSAATAQAVRVFFRLFQAQNTASNFDTSTTYRYASDGIAFGHRAPLLGVQNDQHGNPEYVTIPCFASPRINLSSPADMSAQTDPPNVRDLPTTPGTEADFYFGCWLDVNQPDQKFLPVSPPAAAHGGLDGPWSAVTLESIQASFTAFPHQCLVAEIRYDDTPIPAGETTSTSDKLAQRNIAWIDGPNPGGPASRRMTHPVQLRPTSPLAVAPDELMIQWGTVPSASQAHLYLPSLDAETIVGLAQTRYPVQQLRLADAHTIAMATRGITYLPVPEGTALTAGLLSVDLPPGVKRGDSYSLWVRQLSSASARIPPPPPPPPPAPLPPQIATAAGAQAVILTEAVWQRVVGAFTFTINISTANALLLHEERLLAVLRWMLDVTPSSKRWYPVLVRYIDDVAGRVAGFGGDPGAIEPSPTGTVPGLPFAPGKPQPGKGPPGRERVKVTGKIDGLLHDHFGDFCGFIIESELGHYRRYESRELRMQELAERAWRDRTRVTVVSEPHEPHVPLEVVLRHGGR
jgi:Pro-kumamolisin, activation domain/Subtilase family